MIGESCLVELRGLEPLTPCLQITVRASDEGDDLPGGLTGADRDLPPDAGVSGTPMAARDCTSIRARYGRALAAIVLHETAGTPWKRMPG